MQDKSTHLKTPSQAPFMADVLVIATNRSITLIFYAIGVNDG
jgi:hypothetical protein